MVQKLRQQLGVKLFALMTILILLALVPLTYVVFSTISYFGNYTTEINREQIKKQARSYLAAIAKEQAHKHDAFFSHVAVSSSLMAAQATEIYNNMDYYADLPESLLQTGWAATGTERVFQGGDMVFLLSQEASKSPAASRELKALSRLGPVLKGVRQEIPESISAHLETVTGISCYSSEKGGQNTIEYVSRYSPPQSEVLLVDPFALYQSSYNALGQTVWTGTDLSGYGESLIISARSAVVDSSGGLRGIVGIDIPLARIVNDILEGEPHRAEGIQDETLFSFIIDSHGNVVAFPQRFFSLFGIEPEKETDQESPAVFSFNLAHSLSPQIPVVLPSLLEGQESTVEVRLAGDQYILNMHTMHQLDWHLVLVTLESDLTISVSQTQQALSGTIKILVRKFIANAFLIILSILVIAFIAVAYFVAPLKRLSEAATRVGQGDLQTRCYLDRHDELGTLADSFNSMVRQLEAAEETKKDHARQLETTVAERTRDLQTKNFLLRDVVCELKKESERRRKAVEALKKSEEQIRVAMDGSLAGHLIIQDMKVKYGNPSMRRIFGYSEEEVESGAMEVAELVVADQRAMALRDLDERFGGKTNKPYVLGCIRKDGSVFDALVGGTVSLWQGKPALITAVMDVSEQMKIEEQLKESKHRLQESLKEKEVLLREIYHRTKNNMLVIISMLNLQAMDIEDERVKALFKETENRIRAMSLVHEKLYQSQNLVEVDLGQYLDEMVTSLIATMVIDDRIEVQTDCARVPVSIDHILPLGLAVNEIVTNSIKHGFPDQRKGTVSVRLSKDASGVVEVVVTDDGIGIPADIDIRQVRSLGMQITVNLIEKQLQGTIGVSRNGGTTYRICFSESLRPQRI